MTFMKCPECSYELNLNEKHWSHEGENVYVIHSQLHHETMYHEIVEHYLALPGKAPDGNRSYTHIIIDDGMSQICGCSTCFIQSHRVQSRVEKLYSEQNIYFGFTF